ncbi:MAG: ABC transporter substrate-binding protein [Anaerolineales bacterium]|nr:ABC transporter substrate-binding protein [Anaerolineales bacterium]
MNWRAFRPLVTGLLAAVVLLTAGCTASVPPATATAAESAEPALTPVKLGVGFIPNVQFAPFYVGMDKGFYAEEGIDLELAYGFENDYLKLVGIGELPFVIASGDQVVLGRNQDLPVRYVMNWYTKYPVVVFAEIAQNITAPADLAGKVIGIPGPFGASYVALRGILEAGGLQESDVKLESIGFTQAAAVTAGTVEAAVDYAVNGPVVLAQSGISTTQITLDDYLDIPANGLVTNEQTIQDDPDLVQRMVNATLKSIQYTLDYPDEAFAIALKTVPEAGGENEAANRAVFDASLLYWETQGREQPGATEIIAWQNASDLMERIGLTKGRVPAQGDVHQSIREIMALLIADNISKSFADTRQRLQALQPVSFSLAAGEFVCLLGPSGSGKSTLLRIVGGLLAADTGKVWFDGQPLTAPQPDIGFVFQKTNLMPWRTVIENVLLPLEIQQKRVGEEDVTHAHALLEMLGLHGFADAFPRQLSGGMNQRVVLARTLIHQPRLLLMDEPFGQLDALTRERLNLELQRLHAEQMKTILMVTHSISEAVFLADRVLVFSERPGKIIAQVPVPLPRPRTVETLATPDFAALTGEVRSLIAAPS